MEAVTHGRHTVWWSAAATANSAVVVLTQYWSEGPALRSVAIDALGAERT